MNKTIRKILYTTPTFLYLSTALFAQDEKFELLAPPVLSAETILKEVTCTRPMRDGRFNISTDVIETKRGPKLLVNCYGHGGSGWTTLFGSVSQAIDLFEKTKAAHPEFKSSVRVIGSGCMGLTSAIELTRKGYPVSGIFTRSLYDMPSWRAAGYFALVSVKTSPEEQATLNEIGMNTFLTYQQIDQGQHPYIQKNAVRYMPVYCSEDTESGVEDLEARGLIPPHENVTLDFGNGTTQPHFLKYMTYFMDTTQLMQQLNNEVQRLEIPLSLHEVSSFDDIEEEIIFNCSGLGGRELNHDDKMIPVRGHLFLLNEKAGTGHMDYMIYTKVKQDGKDEYIYMFPKPMAVSSEEPQGVPCQAVLGGTFIPHTDKLSAEDLAKLDAEEFKKMIDRNAIFFSGKPFSN